MLLYRISNTQHAKELSGEGAKKSGGRWNLKGSSVIYTADSTALATLETLVHTSLNLMPRERTLTIFELPDDLIVETFFASQLPPNWSSYPSPIELAERGTTWIETCVTVALRVPSSVTPGGEGWNYLLNPAHSDFFKVQIVDVLPYQFDARLSKM